MFAKTIIDSDAFLDMPLSTQALYFHLSMRADDEGFINNPKKIQRMIGASDDDMKVLFSKNFIIKFETGVVVIKHWKIHNYIRGDRIKETMYQEERAMLEIKENGAYTFVSEPVSQLADTCQSSDSQVTVKCQHRLGKDSIGKDSIGKDSIGEDSIGEDSSVEIPTTTKLDNDMSDIVATWNDMAEANGLPKVLSMNKGTERYKSLKARLTNDKYTLEDFVKAINSIEQSPWLLGASGDWNITFDWLVKKTNFPKVLEGNYIRRNKPTQQQQVNPYAWMENIDYGE